MRTKLLTLSMVLVAVVSMSFMMLPTNPTEITDNTAATAEVKIERITYAELKAKYGANIIKLEAGQVLNDADLLVVNANPCATGPLNIPCKGQLAYIQAAAQQDANACCCTAGYAALCCDPVLGVTSIFAEAEPDHPRCN